MYNTRPGVLNLAAPGYTASILCVYTTHTDNTVSATIVGLMYYILPVEHMTSAEECICWFFKKLQTALFSYGGTIKLIYTWAFASEWYCKALTDRFHILVNGTHTRTHTQILWTLYPILYPITTTAVSHVSVGGVTEVVRCCVLGYLAPRRS